MPRLLITLGPASFYPETIRAMSECKPYVFRINMSHASLDQLPGHIRMIRENSDIPICIDSEGAQIRTHVMQDGAVILNDGNEVELLGELELGIPGRFSLTPKGIVEQFRQGDLIRLDWHGAAIRITDVGQGRAFGRVEKGGRVASCKAVDANREIEMPAITKKDREAIRIGKEYGVHHYALSFANTPENVQEIRALAGPGATIISKLESMSALRNLAGILRETDEALIDRGDLSRAVPIEKIPFLQMRMIAVARSLGTPIFVATNILESMIDSGMPTRAEVNDIVASVLMGADGLVLAAESAVGRHPLQCAEIVRTLLGLCNKWTANSAIEDILSM